MDTLALIDKRVSALGKLYTRMDATRDRVYNTGYTLKGVDGKAMSNVISVTMPYGAIFANTVINDLMDAVRQTVVKGDIPSRQTHVVERFLEDVRAQTDEQLRQGGKPTLFDFWCNHVCVRSFIGARWTSWIENGEYKVDCLPVDMRWTPFEFGGGRLLWAANISWRDEEEIKDDYPEVNVSGNDIEVRDFWSEEKNEVFVAGKQIRERKNPYGYVPFIIGSPATGFMLRDKGFMEHESEDLLYLIKGLYDEINRSVSIEQTVGMEAIQPRYQDIVEEVDASPAEKPPKTGQTAKRKKGLEWQLAPVRDLNQAFLTGRADLMKALQQGGVNEIDLGNVSQTVSAIWITAQVGIRKKFSNPRLRCIAECEQWLARMAIDQFQKVGGVKGLKTTPELGLTGLRTQYNPAQLGDLSKYAIRYELRTSDKMQEIANLAKFEAARDLPMRWKLENILKVDDPDGIIREMELEKAKVADPALSLYEMALKAAQEAAITADDKESNALKIKSKMLTERGVAIIRQRQTPQPLPQEAATPQAEPAKGSSMPLMGISQNMGIGA